MCPKNSTSVYFYAAATTDRIGRTEKRERVRRHVVRLIDDMPPGLAKAFERVLAGEPGLSRSTVRATIEELVAEGFVTRRHGLGTFTSSRQAASDATAGPPDAAKDRHPAKSTPSSGG